MNLENKLINKAAQWSTERLINIIGDSSYSSVDIKKINIGIQILIINITKFILIYGCSLLFGSLYKTLAVHFSFIVTKLFSYGLHAKNSTICTLYCIGIFVFLPYITGYVTINNYVLLPVFMVIIALHALYAPADTKAAPLIGPKKRLKLKRYSVISVALLTVLSLVVNNPEIKTLFLLGSVCQTLAILPITYNILGRSVRNYEMYEA